MAAPGHADESHQQENPSPIVQFHLPDPCDRARDPDMLAIFCGLIP